VRGWHSNHKWDGPKPLTAQPPVVARMQCSGGQLSAFGGFWFKVLGKLGKEVEPGGGTKWMEAAWTLAQLPASWHKSRLAATPSLDFALAWCGGRQLGTFLGARFQKQVRAPGKNEELEPEGGPVA